MKKLLLAIALCSPSIAMASHNCTGTVNNIDVPSSALQPYRKHLLFN